MKLYLKVTDYSREIYDVLNQDLILFANEDEELNLFFLDEFEDNRNINGAIVYFIVKEKPSDSDANAKLNLSYDDSTAPNPGAGEGMITLYKEKTASLLGNYCFQILIQFPTRPMKVACEGIVTFKRRIITSPSGSESGPAPYDQNI
jgi:hypothetical protein